MALSFLEAFNAKQMNTSDIVGSFVPTAHFKKLAGAWHALLIGPRGSGKTTYLKMLELKALRSWSHSEADYFRNEIKYAGIFVPSDIAWGAMVEALGGGKLNKDCFDVIANTAFNTNVMQATIDAIQQRVHLPNNPHEGLFKSSEISSEQLETVVVDIANAWKLKLSTLSLSGLKKALALRMLDLKSLALQIGANPNHALSDVYSQISYASLDMNETLNFAITQIDDAIGDPSGQWALLLDEFEIAPEGLQKLILANLRSSNPKLIYKIALAPCGPHTDVSLSTLAPPTGSNDYKQIELWYTEKSQVIDFCSSIFNSRMAHFEHLCGKSAEDVFGNSSYSDIDGKADSKYLDWNSKWSEDFIDLQRKDASFRDFLDKKGINPEQLDPTLSVIRKIAPLVAFRNAHKTDDNARKGRKKLFFAYTGWEAIATISEGNPRWLIGILNMIASRTNEHTKLPIAQSVQHDEIGDATEEFAAMLQTVAMYHSISIRTNIPIYKLLSHIGGYFNNRLVEDEFIEEPPLSFEVDSTTSADIENALRIAFNHGAIVCLSKSDEIGGFKSLKGKRFRLAYLLAPKFNLPLRSTKSISLNSIMSRLPSQKASKKITSTAQGKFSF